MNAPSSVSFAPSMVKLLKLGAISLVFLGIGIWMELCPYVFHRFDPAFILFIGAAAALLGLFGCGIFVFKMINRKDILRFDGEGVWVIPPTGKEQFIAWTSISKMFMASIHRTQIICLTLREPDLFYDTLPVWKRVLAEKQLHMIPGAHVTFSAVELEIEPQRLLGIANDYWRTANGIGAGNEIALTINNGADRSARF